MRKMWFKNWYAKHLGIKDISDDYSRFVASICVGFLNRGNLYCMDYAIKNMPDNTWIVEIGSYAGLSTAMISHYIKLHNRNTIVYSCDIWEFDFLKETAPCHDHVKNMFVNNMRLLVKNLPYTIKMKSIEFFKLWRNGRSVKDVFGRKVYLGGNIGFAYIDGCHKYGVAMQDFKDVDQSLIVGGFILCDDTAEGCELYNTTFVKDILATKRYELVIENPNALFRKIK